MIQNSSLLDQSIVKPYKQYRRTEKPNRQQTKGHRGTWVNAYPKTELQLE